MSIQRRLGFQLLSKFETLMNVPKRTVSVTKEDCISLASHQVKTPLTSLKLQVEMARKILEKDDLLSHEQVKSIINRTHHDVVRLSRLVDDMVDVSRINIGKFNMAPEHFDLESFLADVIARSSSEIKDVEKVKIVTNAPVLVHWDKFRMEQLIISLLSNALAYGDPDSTEFSVFSGGGQIYMQFADRKHTVPGFVQRKITNLLSTGTPSKKDSRFLSLYICHEIIKLHQGAIWFESSSEKGTVFEIQIPQKLS